jgi:outer membrane immunogenic protein
MPRFRFAALAVVAVFGFASTASAADLPVKAPLLKVPEPAPAYSWTGFYIGANVGGGWGSRSIDVVTNDLVSALFFNPAGGNQPNSPTSFRSSGMLGGLQLGYNWQFATRWLIGVETDFDWSGMQGSASINTRSFGNAFLSTFDEHIKSFGTVRTRLGYLPADNLLAYVTGGFAYGQVERTGNFSSTDINTTNVQAFSIAATCNANAPCFTGSSSSIAAGWTAGAGFEYALLQKWTIKAEYLYVSLNSKSVTETAVSFPPGFSPSSFNANYSRTNFNVARVGVNYHF